MVCCVSQVHNQQEPSAKILAYYFIILVLEESLHSSSASEMFLDIQNSFTKLRYHRPHSTFKYIFHIVQLLFLGQIWDATWLNLRPPSYYHYANKLVPLVHRQQTKASYRFLSKPQTLCGCTNARYRAIETTKYQRGTIQLHGNIRHTVETRTLIYHSNKRVQILYLYTVQQTLATL